MKIVSKRGAKTPNIEINLVDLDKELNDTITIQVEDESGDEQTVFEYYKEDWVIQAATELGYNVTRCVDADTWVCSVNGKPFHVFTEHYRQSHPSALLFTLRDTMNALKEEGL